MKVRENRLRRMAHRQGLTLIRSRRRDPRALDYGVYSLTDAHGSIDFGRNLNAIEAYLNGSKTKEGIMAQYFVGVVQAEFKTREAAVKRIQQLAGADQHANLGLVKLGRSGKVSWGVVTVMPTEHVV